MSAAGVAGRAAEATTPAPPEVRPVLLLTFDVPFSARAVAFAIGTAVQTGAELLV